MDRRMLRNSSSSSSFFLDTKHWTQLVVQKDTDRQKCSWKDFWWKPLTFVSLRNDTTMWRGSVENRIRDRGQEVKLGLTPERAPQTPSSKCWSCQKYFRDTKVVWTSSAFMEIRQTGVSVLYRHVCGQSWDVKGSPDPHLCRVLCLTLMKSDVGVTSRAVFTSPILWWLLSNVQRWANVVIHGKREHTTRNESFFFLKIHSSCFGGRLVVFKEAQFVFFSFLFVFIFASHTWQMTQNAQRAHSGKTRGFRCLESPFEVRKETICVWRRELFWQARTLFALDREFLLWQNIIIDLSPTI